MTLFFELNKKGKATGRVVNSKGKVVKPKAEFWAFDKLHTAKAPTRAEHRVNRTDLKGIDTPTKKKK